MDAEEKAQLIQAWIWHHIDSAGGRHTEENFWAWEKLEDFVFDQPDLAWEVILSILAKDQSDVVVSNLAAGPVENLLVRHGQQFIARMEQQAKVNPAFKHLLGGVWQSSTPNEVWARVQAAAGTRW